MFENDWKIILKDEIKKQYFEKLIETIKQEYNTKAVYPAFNDIFKAFNLTPYKNVKVLILGQDPYHGEGEADGLAFSVPNNIKTPPSLRNILNEISIDKKRVNNDLTDLAKQGVFLLNTVLTVEKDKPLSHRNIGWEIFTDEVIKKINEKEKVIFVLLGKEAQKKKKFISEHHIIIETSHPSPLSVYRGFAGSDIFNKINENLDKKIDWIGENNGKVVKNLEKLNIKYGDAIVIGVSGGPDSMALLDHVIKIRKTKDIQIICAHVNHNMRKESEAEKEYVEEYCLINNIIFEYFKIEDYGDDNFHNEARSIRYKYFGKLIEKYNAKFLLTAHHGDDLIETILMRLVRGSTLKGYSGFSEIIDMGKYKIARPLINVTKAEIVEYNKENKIIYMTDASNEKDVYTRNRFRKYVVSFLKKEDPNVHDKFYKFSKSLLEYNDFIDRYVKGKLNTVYPQNILNIEEFLKEEKVIQTKIIYYILEQIYQDDLMLINDQHVNLIFSMIESTKPNIEMHLPNNISVIKSYNNISLIEGQEKGKDYEIEMIDFINLPNGKNIEKIDKADKNTNFYCRLNSAEISMPLHVRNKKEGDKMQIKGMLGSRKISDIFIDEKIGSAERQTWPIVVDSNNTIVWLPGLKKSKFDKQKDEKCDIILRYY